MEVFTQLKKQLLDAPRHWLVTGAAGFIGSNLVETLLSLGQSVAGLDNFSTGYRRNLEEVCKLVGPASWERFSFIEGDIRNPETCRKACEGASFVLHQAALGSVPRSIANPIDTNACNVNGILNMLMASSGAGVQRFVYASSSSVYGDHPGLPKVEDQIGNCLSPYAVTKRVGELYAAVCARVYQLECIGLRYFNVFGARQDPDGAYAAVIPRWMQSMLDGERIHINGDGETSRDFCYISNVVQANLLAATTTSPGAVNQVYNVAVGGRTTLNELFRCIRERLSPLRPELKECEPVYGDFRSGDVRHSNADISRAAQLLGYAPTHHLEQGLDEAIGWYVARHAQGAARKV